MQVFELLSGALLLGGISLSQAQPVGTAISYQGELRQSGQPADGLFDFEVGLYSSGQRRRAGGRGHAERYYSGGKVVILAFSYLLLPVSDLALHQWFRQIEKPRRPADESIGSRTKRSTHHLVRQTT